MRPRAASTWAEVDCTPNDRRFTPPARYVSTSSGVTLSGLHSTVTSASGVRGTRASTATSSAAGTIDGVPPPTKIDVATGIPASTSRSASVRHAAR